MFVFFRYVNRVKNIKNNVKINEDFKDVLLREFQKEIEKFRVQLVEGKLSNFSVFRVYQGIIKYKNEIYCNFYFGW